jgi:hypothetical protein
MRNCRQDGIKSRYMRSVLIRKVCLAMLLVFVTGLGAGNFNIKWLAHEIGHELEHLAGIGGIVVGHESPGPESDGQGTTEAEHSAMHAAVQLVSVPASDFHWQSLPPLGVIRSFFVAPQIPHATAEAPFRPPRTQAA